MAITSAIMQMRRGNEIDFDPDKMHPGEWAVSTDEKYVRMCFSPGVCVRMATYEAFEEDMEQIIAILEEANTVKEAIEEIYKEFQEAELDIEAAENSATLSESYAHGGTGTREGEDTDNAKYYAESVANTISDVALNRQTLGYTKKNLFNINGDVNRKYNGEVGTYNKVSDGVLTANANRANTSGAGQMIATEIGKTYIVSATVVSLGTGNKATIIVTKKGTNHIKVLDTDEVGKRIFISYTAESTDTLIEFATRGGTGAKFTDIQFEEVADRVITPTDYEPYVDDVDTRLKALTPVNNLLATVPGSPLDAVMGKELNDRLATVEDAFVFYTVELINGWAGELVVSINKINRQATITGYIDGTNATSTVFAKGRISATQAFTERRMPVPIQLTALMAVDNFGTTFQRVSFTTGDDGMEVKVPSTGSLYQFNTALVAGGA